MSNVQELQITDRAQDELIRVMREDNPGSEKGIRISINKGGCSGLTYNIDFGEKQEDDTIHTLDEYELYIDPQSSSYLRGVYLDFQSGFKGRGFVFDNPNAIKTCSCGDSFKL